MAALLFFLVLVGADILVAFYALRETLYPQVRVQQEQVMLKVYFPIIVRDEEAHPVELPTETPMPAPSTQPVDKKAAGKYVIQPGDTLFEIAQKYGVSLESLAAANQIADPDVISAGQELVIPAGLPTPTLDP